MDFTKTCKHCGNTMFDRQVRRLIKTKDGTVPVWTSQDACSSVCESELRVANRVSLKQKENGLIVGKNNIIEKDDFRHPSKVEKKKQETLERFMEYSKHEAEQAEIERNKPEDLQAFREAGIRAGVIHQ